MHDRQRLVVLQAVVIVQGRDTVCSGKDIVNSCASLRCVAVLYKQKVRFGREVEGGRGEEGRVEISCDVIQFPV